MYSLITLSICITIMCTSSIAAPLKDDEKIDKKPDIEDFIDRLLTSEKFEQLADKIAQRAADRIITLQQETSRHSEKKPDKRARDDDVTKHQSNSTHKAKNEHKGKQSDFDKDTEEKKENKNDKKRTKKSNDKSKIDTIAAIQKISAFPTAELSLNYKHFTARETPSTKSPKAHRKGKEDNEEKSHRKHESDEGDYEALPRAQLSDVSEFQAEPKDGNKKEDLSLSIDEKKESSELKKIEHKHDKKDKKNNLHRNEKTESESGSSENDESSGSNESQFTTKSSKTKTEKSINASKKVKKSYDSDEKDESDEADTTTPAILRVRNNKQTVAFGFVDTEKSSQESESDDNKVSNIVDSAKLNEKLIEKSKEETKSKEEKEKKDKEDINEEEKEKDEKGDKSNETEKKDDVIDTKHKVREKNGKLYAFAESPDYEEYHEKLASLLQSVKSNETKRNMVSRDLLDFVI